MYRNINWDFITYLVNHFFYKQVLKHLYMKVDAHNFFAWQSELTSSPAYCSSETGDQDFPEP